jgi:hypothetical protein
MNSWLPVADQPWHLFIAGSAMALVYCKYWHALRRHGATFKGGNAAEAVLYMFGCENSTCTSKGDRYILSIF